MKKPDIRTFLVIGTMAIISACVTINVYFPEAAAEQAADTFINNVIGEDDDENTQASYPVSQPAFSLLDLLFPAAHAQSGVNIDINTPEIQAIQRRMEQRFDDTLSGWFDLGAIGFDQNATITIRDLSAVGLKDRNALKAAVNADNADRKAVYREIAVANGHPEWEDQIRATFAERWISNAQTGWYYQTASGAWQQK